MKRVFVRLYLNGIIRVCVNNIIVHLLIWVIAKTIQWGEGKNTKCINFDTLHYLRHLEHTTTRVVAAVCEYLQARALNARPDATAATLDAMKPPDLQSVSVRVYNIRDKQVLRPETIDLRVLPRTTTTVAVVVISPYSDDIHNICIRVIYTQRI